MTGSVFICPCCGATSSHPDDIAQNYCARCHWYTGDPQLGPPHLAEACPERKATEMTELHPFIPDWTLSPGVLLRRVMAGRNLAEADLSRCGLLPETIAGILAGTSAIGEDAAIRIANATGVPSSFWLNAEHVYRSDLARGAEDVSSESKESPRGQDQRKP